MPRFTTVTLVSIRLGLATVLGTSLVAGETLRLATLLVGLAPLYALGTFFALPGEVRRTRAGMPRAGSHTVKTLAAAAIAVRTIRESPGEASLAMQRTEASKTPQGGSQT
jgi:hypothetical protein